MLSVAELDNTPVRRPGDFQRHPKTGAPFVAHPTETTKRTGLKADLIVECAQAGIAVPDKVTVAQLQALLGPRPKMVQYGRPSGLGKQIENMTNLQKWSERMVATGIGDSLELMAEARIVAGLERDSDEWRDRADTLAVAAKDRAQAMLAAERGTFVHAITDDRDSDRDWIHRIRDGEDLGLPSEVQNALVAAWDLMLATYDLTILASEATCVDDVWRQAGTLDCIARLGRDLTFILSSGEMVTIPAGAVIVLDKKTGQLRLDNGGFVSYWHGYSVQVASYAQSVPYDADTDTRGDWGFEIGQRWAVIAHLDVLAALDGAAVCRLVLVDLEAGRHAGAMCVAAREWESRRDVFSLITDDLAVTVPVTISDEGPNLTSDATGECPTDPPVAAISDEAPDPVPSDAGGISSSTLIPPADLAYFAHQIATWDDSVKQRLAAVWPADLATPKCVRDGVAVWGADAVAALRAVMHEAQAPWSVLDQTPNPEPPRSRNNFAVVLDSFKDQPPDDGGPLDPAALEALLADAVDVRMVINAWLVEASEAGCNWNPRRVGTVRSFEQARAARALASMWDPDDDFADAFVRLILSRAIGTEAAAFPMTPIGVAIGALTIAEALAVVDTVDAINGERLILQFADDGTPLLVA